MVKNNRGKGFSRLHLEPYDPAKVPGTVAREIEDLVAKDAKGELDYEGIGAIPVRPPQGR